MDEKEARQRDSQYRNKQLAAIAKGIMGVASSKGIMGIASPKIVPSFTTDVLKGISTDPFKVAEHVKIINGTSSKFKTLMNGYSDPIESIRKQFGLPAGVSKFIVESPDIVRDVGKRIAEIFDQLPEALEVIRDAGWACDLSFAPVEVLRLARLIKTDKKVDVDEFMSNILKGDLDEIFVILGQRHTTRQHILQEIRQCYVEKMFFVGILGVMSQIDGICHDHSSQVFFQTKKPTGLPRFTYDLSIQPGRADDLFLTPIKKPPMTYHEKDEIPNELNRHSAMHGKDLSYGTEMNFYKCLALLKYISDLVSEYPFGKTHV